MSLGWTWAQIDEMTFPQVGAFNRYWINSPPVHIMVADYLGYKKKATKPTKDADMGQFFTEAGWMNGKQ